MANVDQKAVKNESRLRQSVKQAGAQAKESNIKVRTFKGVKIESGSQFDIEDVKEKKRFFSNIT